MYHYVYIVDQVDTGEYYIGSRSSIIHPSLDPYLGSMKTWKPDKVKLRKKIIRDDFENRSEAINFEISLIRENIDHPLNRNYNIPGFGFHTSGFVTVRDNENRCFNVRSDDPRYLSGELKYHRKGMKNSKRVKRSNRTPEREYERLKRVEIMGSHRGSKNSQFGTRWINDGINTKKIKKNEPIPDGWKLGAIQNKLKGLGWITNGVENARLDKNKTPPDGWKFGKTQRKK